ncbi:putative receptor-like protein kinase At4g00960 [Manihot esculenta]|uniref:Cysteine-rich receptor-like protein kinase 29 n=1 Tax=Manihot esculenta TaxID=3983 RepID=A0A2C9WE80_MANES|nr:putative receptor-like protein kinase At4g00960 [Manihot esculenta]OAY58168.1 hypothetical protein MANES_02G155400v8 [Manihot esculenta]
MASSTSLFFLCPLAIHFLVLTAQSQPEMLYKACLPDKGNYAIKSTYQANLKQLLTSIYTNTEINNGFYNFSYGQDPDVVKSIALCRPDITPQACRDCIKNASDSLLVLCPTSKEAIGGLDDCMVRYSYRDIFRLNEGRRLFFFVHSNDRMKNVSESKISGFNQSRMTLLDSLRDRAAAGDSRYKFDYNQTLDPNFQTIYALVQCTPDLTESECRDCLHFASGLIPECCEFNTGGRVINPSCNFRYETDRFYSPENMPSAPSPPPPGKSLVVIIVIVTVAVSTIVAICVFIFLRARNKKKEFKRTEAMNKKEGFNGIVDSEIEDAESLQFDFGTVRTATNDFSEENKLGQGGFGAVYKGELPNGQHIAVKRLSKESKQGQLEFKNEVLLVAKLQHKNLVRLLGFCLERKERLLIYEFVPNSSLDHFIFDPIKRTHLDWERRYKIIVGIARGLLYLHEDSRLRIIHRDLKASNVLLDEEMNPKISDFGMARLFEVDQTQEETSRIVGTFGYMAPEYIHHGRFSVKSDVFSFGVLVLEIASGQKSSGAGIGEEEEDLLTYSWKNWNEGTALNLIDPTMRVAPRSEMMRSIHIGLLCVQEHEANRPTMAQVFTLLGGYSITLPVPSKPAFFMQSALRTEASLSTNERSNEDVQQSRNEVSTSELYPR